MLLAGAKHGFGTVLVAVRMDFSGSAAADILLMKKAKRYLGTNCSRRGKSRLFCVGGKGVLLIRVIIVRLAIIVLTHLVFDNLSS